MTKLDDILSAQEVTLKVTHSLPSKNVVAKEIQSLVKKLNLTDEQIERAKQIGLWEDKE